MLVRYWLEFLQTTGSDLPCDLKQGMGVTARDFDDALDLIQDLVFPDEPMPLVDRIIENVDLDQVLGEEVLANVWAPVWRGIWYPMGFQDNMEPDVE